MSISAATLSANVAKNIEIDAGSAADLARFKVYANLTNVQIDLLNKLPLKWLRDGMRTVKAPMVGYEDEYQWPSDLIRFVWLKVLYPSDTLTYADGGITASTTALGSLIATFTAADVGKNITVIGAGAAGANLYTTIAGFISEDIITLTDQAQTTVSGATFSYGTARPITVADPGKEVSIYDQDAFLYPFENIGTVDYPFGDTDAQDAYHISPRPLLSNVDGIRLRYVYNPPAIASGQDAVLNPNLQTLLEYEATARSLLVDTNLYNPTASKYWHDLYLQELKQFMPKEEIDK